jgi:hypothetical protein
MKCRLSEGASHEDLLPRRSTNKGARIQRDGYSDSDVELYVCFSLEQEHAPRILNPTPSVKLVSLHWSISPAAPVVATSSYLPSL